MAYPLVFPPGSPSFFDFAEQAHSNRMAGFLAPHAVRLVRAMDCRGFCRGARQWQAVMTGLRNIEESELIPEAQRLWRVYAAKVGARAMTLQEQRERDARRRKRGNRLKGLERIARWKVMQDDPALRARVEAEKSQEPAEPGTDFFAQFRS